MLEEFKLPPHLYLFDRYKKSSVVIMYGWILPSNPLITNHCHSAFKKQYLTFYQLKQFSLLLYLTFSPPQSQHCQF